MQLDLVDDLARYRVDTVKNLMKLDPFRLFLKWVSVIAIVHN